MREDAGRLTRSLVIHRLRFQRFRVAHDFAAYASPSFLQSFNYFYCEYNVNRDESMIVNKLVVHTHTCTKFTQAQYIKYEILKT